jgi:hypothetical protein
MDLTTVLDKLLLPLALLAGQLWLNARFKSAEDKRDAARADTDAKRKAEAEWRDGITTRLDEIEGKVDRSITQQAMWTRSDIVHKCHRYLDDLGKASTEEKQALHDEHVQYSQFCDDLGIDNNFIDNLVARVMELPEREV